ncbi:MAG: FYDLN acid domain-containing protein [Hyphomicrobiaceae bacterium]
MARIAERGTKRTCQGTSCGARFYDLNRNPITCPECGTVYQLAVSAAAVAAPGAAAAAQRRPAKKPEYVSPDVVADTPEVEGEDVLADVEGTEEPVAAGEEETFLEEEDEGGDVSGIIGGTPADGEEEV